jgi:hypothetical protein
MLNQLIRQCGYLTLCIFSAWLAPASMAEDEKIPELRTSDGKVFQNVTVTKIEADSIRIMHETGVAKIQFELIPDELKKKYNMSIESVEVYRKKLREQQSKQQRETKLSDFVWKKVIKLEGEVLQVLDGGVLVNDALFMKVGVEGAKFEKIPVSPVFVECDSSKYVDGYKFDEYVFYDGNFTYGNVQGAKKTIVAFTTNRDKFLKKSGYETVSDAVEKGEQKDEK